MGCSTNLFPSIPYLFLPSTRRADAAYHLGFRLVAKGKIDDAVEAFERCLLNDPMHAAARSKLKELLNGHYEDPQDSDGDFEGNESDSD